MAGLVHKAYVDVNGTDYSTQVFSVDSNRKLSDVGTCAVVLNNKGGQYKTAFSEMQRVAVGQARAAFVSPSDFFVGSTVNATKWTTQTGASIDSNKLKLFAAAGDATVRSPTISVPYTFTCWIRNVGGSQVCYAYGYIAPNEYWRFEMGAGPHFKVYSRQGGAWAVRWTSASTWTSALWYFIVAVIQNTSIRFYVYDLAYGTTRLIEDSGAITVDSMSNSCPLGFYCVSAETMNVKTVLVWNDTSVKGEQVFEGVIDKIEFNHSPETITLHCLDDAWELEKQYDETYGRATATFTPSYGATDDISVLTSALLPTGWTYINPDCAIHDKQVISINTRRIYALNELLDLTPYLGWYVLPMKHFCWVMADTYSTPDAWTEATAGWTKTGASNTLGTDNTYNIDGSWCLVLADAVGMGTAIGAYYAVNFSCLSYRIIILYYGKTALIASPYVRIYTDTVTPKYWQYNLPDPPNACGSRDNMVHFIARLPDADGTHGWVATGAPSTADNIVRVQIGGVSADPAAYLYWDVLYFVAVKRLTSKYTISNLISVNKALDADQYTRAMVVGSGITTQVVDDATMQSTYGLREILTNDQSITTAEPALAEARTLLNLQGWDDTADPIQATVINPGDMYNLMLGDTVTITYTNFNLSSATRTVIARSDTLSNNGWLTTLTLSGDPTRDRMTNVLAMAKRKRY